MPLEFWEETQKELGAVIQSPPLTEKLLRKPPFRFVHDIIMSLLQTYGFARGLIADAERDARAFEEKEQKVAFLEKVILLTARILRTTLPVRASKITSGGEVENTNEFLRALARAARASPEEWPAAEAAVRETLARRDREGEERGLRRSHTDVDRESSGKPNGVSAIAPPTVVVANHPAAAPKPAEKAPSPPSEIDASSGMASAVKPAAGDGNRSDAEIQKIEKPKKGTKESVGTKEHKPKKDHRVKEALGGSRDSIDTGASVVLSSDEHSLGSPTHMANGHRDRASSGKVSPDSLSGLVSPASWASTATADEVSPLPPVPDNSSLPAASLPMEWPRLREECDALRRQAVPLLPDPASGMSLNGALDPEALRRFESLLSESSPPNTDPPPSSPTDLTAAIRERRATLQRLSALMLTNEALIGRLAAVVSHTL